MKIIHITASYKPAYIYGGPVQSVGKLCESLKKLGVSDVQVLTTAANGKHELNVETRKQQFVDGIPVTYFQRLTKDHSHFSPGLLWGLRKLLLQAHHDKTIVHIHAWWNLVSVLSCWVAKWYNIPVVLSPRGMLTSYTQGNRNSFAKKIVHSTIGEHLLKYCHIHATSEQEREDILKIIRPKSVTVIPNLVSIPQVVSDIKLPVSTQNLKLIFLSRIEEKKGLGILFEALALVKFPWSLTIAGSGSDRYVTSLKAKAERLKLNNRIEWLGQISNEAKFDLLANHDLCVLTSYNENFANVIIESLSVGTAVLISDKVGLADYVAENDLGWITILNVEQISQQLEKVAEDRLKREIIRTNAPQIIREDFDDEVLVLKYLDLYKLAIKVDAENNLLRSFSH